MTRKSKGSDAAGDIAVVGLSVCVPGAQSLAAFWNNLRDGVESIQILDEDRLRAAGERPDRLSDPNYVRSAALLDDFDQFDAEFFGFSPKEAAILDPQHRKFLEVAWEAMEVAGHPPGTNEGPVGVYAGCGMGSYFYFNICSNPELVDDVGMFLLRHTGNDKDFLSTRVSHVFDLKGPSLNIQTACSTSLVAIHYACDALRSGEVDMALAGGVTIELPQGRGYLYKDNEILSPDGHCHAFDHRAQGTVFGSGAGAVALRRLEDAERDGDHIWAIIKGSSVNNDGAAKAGYLAPSVEGQADAVRRALHAAQVSADSIDYVEAHGTGTYLGDPIEIAALTEAYRDDTSETGYCRVGSVKTNIGHLDTAAGIAGFAKTTLALHHGQIPPSLNYEAPNPTIDFATSPFRVNDTLTEWPKTQSPPRAAVNALGVGGTNAHLILEAAPERPASEESEFPFQVLCLSGHSRAALDANADRLANFLSQNSDVSLADVAFTLKEGRKGFDKRRVLVAETPQEAIELLKTPDPRQVFDHTALSDAPDVVFMFPGGGAQYTNMARDLYETEPVFADWMDRGLDHLQTALDYDIRRLWLPEPEEEASAAKSLLKPSVQLPLIMIVEYALAQLWISWGVKPAALVGHSMGENTAACLAGVLSFEDCIDLVHLRGRLFDTVPAGGMLSISLSHDEVANRIGADLDIASVNAAELTAVSGPNAALDALAAQLDQDGIDYQRVPIDIAAHSRMLDPILQEYGDFLSEIRLSAPKIAIHSNRTGTLLSAKQATDPAYWVSQLRNTVMFADCIEALAQKPDRVFLEVGPGKALSTLAQMHKNVNSGQVLSTLRHPDQDMADDAYFVGAIGRLWACGVDADWAQIWGDARRNRIPLPTYAFQRNKYFIEPGTSAPVASEVLPDRAEDLAGWGYRPRWKPEYVDCDVDVTVEAELSRAPLNWLFFMDDTGFATGAASKLEDAGHTVTRVYAGDFFAKRSDGTYTLAPEQGVAGYEALLQDLAASQSLPDRIAHFWLVTREETFRPGASFFDRNVEMGFLSLTHLMQASASVEMPEACHMSVFTSGAAQVRSEGLPYPEKALVAGPVGVAPREFPDLTCSSIDVHLPQTVKGMGRLFKSHPLPDNQHFVLNELLAKPRTARIAWRGDTRFVLDWKAAELPPTDAPAFETGGTYVITGGYGGIGLTVAAHLLREYSANVVLLSRDGLPARDEWDATRQTHSPANRVVQRIRAVEALEQIGRGTVLTLAADVCHSDQMRQAIEEVRGRYGNITGVLHGAGEIDDGPLLNKTEEGMAKVFAPKVSGLRVLNDLLPDGSIDLLVLFSSSSTVTTPAGQVDYVAANEYLNAYAQQRAGGTTRVVSVNWGVWSDVGMAADALLSRTPRKPTDFEPCNGALLEERCFDIDGNPIFQLHLDENRSWILNEHRTAAGQALIPGTGYIELAAEVMHAQGVEHPFTIEDLTFFRPLVANENGRQDVLLRLIADADGYALNIYSKAHGVDFALNAQMRISLAPATLPRVDLAAVDARCAHTDRAGQGHLSSPQEVHLQFGPRWKALKQTAFGTEEGIARLELPEAAAQDGCIAHPGLMDLATGWAMKLVPEYQGHALWVPVSYDAIEIHAPLTRDVASHVVLAPGSGDGFARFNITICDPNGRVLVSIRGFQMKRLEGEIAIERDSTPDATAQDLGLEETAASTPVSAEERRMRHNVSQGIRGAEGAEALSRALSANLNQVVISSLDLHQLLEQHQLVSKPTAGQDHSFDRPELDTAFVAPRNAVEEAIADLFTSLLGVATVGVEDSFFDLGGHSLIAVRLFAQIKRQFKVDFPMSVLFEAPSVAALSDMIIAKTGGGISVEGEASSTGTATPDQPNFENLVKLHPGDGTGKRPFFLVAGMFGNVLNLRQLALLVGRDRPVYGLQARGLVGDADPHESLAAAAADYLSEIKQVQPFGPYQLGGFSGGGLTAFEMAHALKDAGEQVAALILLDTPMPLRPVLTRKDRILIKVEEFRRKGLGYFAEWIGSRVRWEFEKRRNGNDAAADTEFNNSKMEAAFRRALACYDMRPWDGPLTLFRPPLDRHWPVSNGKWVSSAREYVLDDNDWRRWAEQTHVIEVPGDHDSMVLVPNVSVLAQNVRDILNATEPTPGTGSHSQHKTAAE